MPGIDYLLEQLDIESIERNMFRGTNPMEGHVFGGHVASQALRAAQRTVDVDHHVHSLHSYFLRPGIPLRPILYSVTRIRDGRSFTTRTVVAIQDGEAIFNVSVSFHKTEPGPEYQLPFPLDAPDPESLPRAQWGSDRMHHRPIEQREVPLPPVSPTQTSTRRMWLRADGGLPDDPAIHACVLTYASDMGPVGAARRPHFSGEGPGGFMGASLDHAMWFHRSVRADEWLLYDLEAVSTSNARGLARGTIHTRAGDLAVSLAQEALLRPVT